MSGEIILPGVFEKAFEKAGEVPLTDGLGGPRIGRVTSIREVDGELIVTAELDEPETPRVRGNCGYCGGARYARPRDVCETPTEHYISSGLRYVRTGGAWYPEEIPLPGRTPR